MDEAQIQVSFAERFKKYYERYMLVVGTLGQAFFFIQGINIFMNQSAKDVSLFGFSVALFTVSSWFIYGILIKNKALIISNFCAVVGALIVVIGTLIYGN